MFSVAHVHTRSITTCHLISDSEWDLKFILILQPYLFKIRITPSNQFYVLWRCRNRSLRRPTTATLHQPLLTTPISTILHLTTPRFPNTTVKMSFMVNRIRLTKPSQFTTRQRHLPIARLILILPIKSKLLRRGPDMPHIHLVIYYIKADPAYYPESPKYKAEPNYYTRTLQFKDLIVFVSYNASAVFMMTSIMLYC